MEPTADRITLSAYLVLPYGIRYWSISMTLTLRAMPKRLMLALSVLPFLGVVAAFGVAPDTATERIKRQTIVQDLTLDQIQPSDSGNFDFWREERIGRGETLTSLLVRLGINNEDIREFLGAAREVRALGRLVPGQSVLARVTANGRLITFRYLVTDSTLVMVNRVEGRLKATEQAAKIEIRPIMRSGGIQASLFGATDAADIPDRIASDMAEIFSGDIDFHRDLRRGDHFSVIYEARYFDGQMVGTGRILAAEFINQSKPYLAIYFKDPQGHDGYYGADGKSLRHAFLKSPMPFNRISSGFSLARYHPILQRMRAHKGIDYAAPVGTPVRAVADATVLSAGKQGGYGNLIVLKHQGLFSSAYGHLSRYAKGVRRGAHIHQGEVIGYVGMTGLATGPHLHYEFRVDGVQRNPLTMKLPTSNPLEARDRVLFTALSRQFESSLDRLRNTNLTSLD